MNRIFSIFIAVALLIQFSGCSHRYSSQEYEILRAELESNKRQVDTCQTEKSRLESSLDEARKNMEKASADITSSYSNKQMLLDKNIECMEDNKALLKQVSRLKVQIQEKKDVLGRINRANEYLLDFLEADRMNDQLYIVKGDEAVKIIIPQKVLFPTVFSSWITPKGTTLLKKIAKGLVELKPLHIEVDGHTDATPIPKQTLKTFPTQWDLSNSRATSVLLVLEGSGIKKDKLFIGSYADTRPIAELKSDEGKVMNGRVEIVITP